MSLLTKNSTGAERARGCVFAENFENASKIVENGGIITGALTFNNSGATFDGTNDYITYSPAGNVLYSDNLSVVIEFTPDWVSNDNLSHVLLWSSDNSYRIYKYSDGATNDLVATFGGVSPIYLTYNVWSPYWNEYKKNVLVVTSTNGSTKAYLNGTLLWTSVSAWTKTDSGTFLIGDNITHTRKYGGAIKSVKIFNTILTAQEAIDFYNNSTYNYRNKAIVDLPMGMAQHDPTNIRTLDVSGKGNNATLGDGSTASTFPTKLSKRGYSFDGGDYMIKENAGLVGASGLTVYTVIENVSNATSIVASIEKSDNSAVACILQNYATTDIFAFYGGDSGLNQAAQFTRPKRPCGKLIIIGTTNGTTTSIYVNGQKGTNASSPAALVQDASQRFVVGARGNLTTPFSGNILASGYFNFALTPLQIQDLTINLMKKINDI